MLLKWCTQYASKFGKLSSGHRTEKGVFTPVPKKDHAKECSNYHTVVLMSHANKVMLKIFQASFQQYVNWELPDIQLDLEKPEEPHINCQHLLDHRKREFQKNTHFRFTDYAKVFVYITTNCGKFLEMGISDQLTCLLWNLYAGQEAIVRTWHGTTDWF